MWRAWPLGLGRYSTSNNRSTFRFQQTYGSATHYSLPLSLHYMCNSGGILKVRDGRLSTPRDNPRAPAFSKYGMDGAFVVGCGSGVVVGCGVAARFGQIQHEQQSQHFPISTNVWERLLSQVSGVVPSSACTFRHGGEDRRAYRPAFLCTLAQSAR